MEARWARLCGGEDTERLVLERLERSGLAAHMKRRAQLAIERSSVRPADVEAAIHSCIAVEGLDVVLKNAVYHELCELWRMGPPFPLPASLSASPFPASLSKEPLGFIRDAQRAWEETLHLGITALSTKLAVPLARERSKAESEAVRKKWPSIGTAFPVSDLEKVHPIFSPRDFVEVLVRVRNTNFDPGLAGDGTSCAGLVSVGLNTKSVSQLQRQFSALRPSVHTEGGLAEHARRAGQVVRQGLSALSRQQCKAGCPVALRQTLWSQALGVDCQHPEITLHFERLKLSVQGSSLLLERVIMQDVKKMAANDDNYFVFEDLMHQVLLCFLHDSSMLRHYSHLSPTPLSVSISSDDTECEVVYPPSGVIPFHGFSMLVTPLCFLFDQSDQLYALFKHLYLRYFVHLHCLSSRPQGILGLCCLFESLLRCRNAELFLHLTAVAAPPLQLAFPWLMTAFAGHLDSRELLQLWDRIIGFDSLEIVAVLAVALFEFRAANLFKASSYSDAETVLSELRCLKVLPLLQQVLFL